LAKLVGGVAVIRVGAAAIEKLNGQELGGRFLKVNEAKQRENRVGFN
jgi:hypothetical protein